MRLRTGIACALGLILLLASAACLGPGLEPPLHERGEPSNDRPPTSDAGEQAAQGGAGASPDADLDAGTDSVQTDDDGGE